ncbi:urea ABC transporter permease subunit UrtB, partial [Ottowia sp.]|uniref:ABC transporter permease subunit n=1 Tax=Ottowia sp. TaxID=1898956 RepID=UPI00345EC768
MLLALLLAPGAWAVTAEQALKMATGDGEDRVQAINEAVLDADDRTRAFIDALSNDAVKASDKAAFVMDGDQATDPVTGAKVKLPDDAEDVINNNFLRSALDAAKAALQLHSEDEATRAAAAAALMKDPDESRLPLIDRALAAEKSPAVRDRLELARATTLLASHDAAKRLQAAEALQQARSPDIKLLLNEQLSHEDDPKVKAAIQAAIAKINEGLAWGDRLGVLFTGASLGSILLLAALGLAITYGLMGVINMAHGELIMIGAYATYVMQVLFQRYLPDSAFGWYLVAAVPVSFLASALVGAVLERGVIRFLYGRPLETLLATWGISLVLIQTVRSLFGAQNVGVENPSW